MIRPLRIAVADDEPDIREFFERYLPRLGHQVASVAENGRQLVEQCREAHPDLIITAKAFSIEEGLRCTRALLERRSGCTAVAAGNDMLAVGCLATREAAGEVLAALRPAAEAGFTCEVAAGATVV